MLVVGVGNLSSTEWRTHLSLWSLLAAPLWIGADLTGLPGTAMDVLRNREVIEIDKDPLAIMARRVRIQHEVDDVANGLAAAALAVAPDVCSAASFSHSFRGIQ
jgi:alpha-galactosidase